MAIRNKGTKWQVDVTYLGVRAPRISCDTAEEARKIEAHFRAHLMNGGDPAQLAPGAPSGAASTVTLSRLVDATIAAQWRGTKGEENATRNAHSWCEEMGYDYPVHKLRGEDIADVVDAWAERGLAAGTINRKIAALSVMLNIAEEREWITKKPKLTRKKEYEGRLRYFSDNEVESLIDHSEGDIPLRNLIILAVETGMRQGELLGLTKRDVDLDRGLILLGETKGNKRRSVLLTDRARRSAKSMLQGAHMRDHERLFEDRLTCRNISRWMATWKTKMGLPKDDEACFHTLRHTTCSRLVQRGVPIVVVQKWMGHATIQTTMKYAHLAPDSLNLALAALNDPKKGNTQ